MTVFIDTSALLALLDGDDDHHGHAVERWGDLAKEGAVLASTNYVVLETIAVVQHRLGLAAVRAFARDIVPLLEVTSVEAATDGAALTALLAADRRRLSFVDCASFEVMGQVGIKRAFAYDTHFDEQGLTLDEGA